MNKKVDEGGSLIFRWLGKFIRFIFRLGFTLALIIICVYVDARYIEPKVIWIKEEVIPTEKLSNGSKMKVVLFNDVHLGEYYSLSDFEKVVKKINALKPDILIFAGDLVEDNKTFTEEEGATQLLGQLSAKYGKYAVFGNHDHGGNGTKRYARMMQASGFTLLRNQQDSITLENGEKVKLIGIDDIVLSKPDFKAAFEGVTGNTFNLFISHAPDVVDKIIDQPVDLQVSGHSHGGQVRLPFIGAPFTVPYGEKYIKGLYYPEEKEDMLLYVNSGIGTSQVPYRFLNLPEITVLSIKGTAIKS
ncbi:MAG: metallophosphoesterase [Cellulosilyticum sp.]|nr:metallophosphoesterase [Cellulosilyticum sp.]